MIRHLLLPIDIDDARPELCGACHQLSDISTGARCQRFERELLWDDGAARWKRDGECLQGELP